MNRLNWFQEVGMEKVLASISEMKVICLCIVFITPNAKVGIYQYTLNLEECDDWVRIGWKDEGIAGYGIGIE